MGELINFTYINHKKTLYKGLWECFQDEYKTDFVLMGRNGEYSTKIHFLMLAIFCPSLRECSGKTLSLVHEEVEMNDTDVGALVEYMYRGKVSVSEDRLAAVRVGAQVLGLNSLVEQIDKHKQTMEKRNDIERPEIPNSFEAERQQPETLLTPTVSSEEDAAVLEGEAVKLCEVVMIEDGMSVTHDDLSDMEMSDVDKEGEDTEEYVLPGQKLSGRRARRTKRQSTIDEKTAEHFDPGCELYLCKHCGKGFKVARDFFNHTRCHERKMKCSLCEHVMSGKNRLVRLHAHMVCKHHVDLDGTKLEKSIKCPDCVYTCRAQFQLKNHTYQSHSKPYKCDVCGYCCGAAGVLSRHVQAVHQKERPYACESCGFRAKTWQVLRNHVKMHDGKKIVCSYCGQSLTVKSFPGHVKLHTSDEKPHVCHLCSFSARKKHGLKVHLKKIHDIEMERNAGPEEISRD